MPLETSYGSRSAQPDEQNPQRYANVVWASMCMLIQDPHLGGNSVADAEARKAHAEERRQQALEQATAYREHRIETRWPYMSPCTKVWLVLSLLL